MAITNISKPPISNPVGLVQGSTDLDFINNALSFILQTFEAGPFTGAITHIGQRVWYFSGTKSSSTALSGICTSARGTFYYYKDANGVTITPMLPLVKSFLKSVTVPANSGQLFEYTDYNIDGRNAIGIVGASSINGGLVFYRSIISGDEVQIGLRNVTSSSITANIYYQVLYF